MKKQRMRIVFMVLLLVLLAACGKIDESTIKSDFIEQDDYLATYDMTVDEFQITGRKTTGKSDIITVHVESENEYFRLTRDCVMDYEKYNDGWKLDSVVTEDMDYLADNEKVTQTDADEAVGLLYPDGELSFIKREDSDNHVKFYYNWKNEVYYSVSECTLCAECTFTPNMQWEGDVTEGETKSSVDLIGEWSYQDGERSYWVKIIDFDLANRNVRYEYEFHDKNNIGDGYTHFIYDAQSAGEVVGKYYSYGFESWNKGTFSWHMDTEESGLKQLDFFVGEEAEAKNGMGAGVSFNGYWLKRQ